jgi:hypothetical protein
MCHVAQQQVYKGYCSMLMKSGDFQFSHKMWLEDSDGFEVPIEHSHQQMALQQWNQNNCNYYKELVKQTQRASKCYELYALYLGMLSVAMVASHERTLIQAFCNRKG